MSKEVTMNEKLIAYLKSICSSDLTIRAAKELDEENSKKLLDIFEDFDLGDCTIFYMCKMPAIIDRISNDLKTKGYITPSLDDMIFKVSYKLGYC